MLRVFSLDSNKIHLESNPSDRFFTRHPVGLGRDTRYCYANANNNKPCRSMVVHAMVVVGPLSFSSLPPAIPSKMQIQFDNNCLVSRQAGGSGTNRQRLFLSTVPPFRILIRSLQSTIAPVGPADAGPTEDEVHARWDRAMYVTLCVTTLLRIHLVDPLG